MYELSSYFSFLVTNIKSELIILFCNLVWSLNQGNGGAVVGFSGFLLLSKNVGRCWTGCRKLPQGVNVCVYMVPCDGLAAHLERILPPLALWSQAGLQIHHDPDQDKANNEDDDDLSG